jgi:hypothetical protein
MVLISLHQWRAQKLLGLISKLSEALISQIGYRRDWSSSGGGWGGWTYVWSVF